jgi:glycosyltransferase involved in cell wall biosynthesis
MSSMTPHSTAVANAAIPSAIAQRRRDPRHPRAVVAIPVRDEADRISACILALARQTRIPDAVLLLLNNCSDLTEAIARNLAATLPFDLRLARHAFAPPNANAGNARRMAMQLAVEFADPDGVLLTTDADAVVADDWVERNLLALAAGADVACGRVEVDAIEATLIPLNLRADDALEQRLTELLDRIACLVDPDPADPWPRHTEAAGASIAVTMAAFRRTDGIPRIAAGEDRAFVATLARMDARVRHDPTVKVTVSGRIHGRAEGGMADTIRRRMRQQDEFADDHLEPAGDAYRRVDFRRRVRLAWGKLRVGHSPPTDLAVDLGIPDEALPHLLRNRFCGAAWSDIEAASPFLRRRRVRFADLPREISYARQLLGQDVDWRAIRPGLALRPDPTDSSGQRG